MVAPKDIQASNGLINDATAPRVSVFVGGTSGIGKFTVKALVSTGASVRIYLIGRKSSEERTKTFIQELNAINPKAEIVWAEAEVSLLADVKRVCGVIKGKESRVDLLFLTTGFAPFGARQETSEGIEISQSLEYYSRVLFIQHLLPLLSEAETPRVVSVGGGGLERMSFNVDDIDLKEPGNFSLMKAQPQWLMLNTLGLDKLAEENPNVTFIHSWPGWVDTGNVWRGIEPGSITSWLVWLFLQPLIRLLSFSDDDSGQRHLFQSTSAAFGGRGITWQGKTGVNSQNKEENGLFLVNYKCDCTPNAKVIPQLREKAREKAWNHTQQILQPYQ